MILGLLIKPCFAGWISEIQPAPRIEYNLTRQAMLTIPSLVELSGLKGLSQVDLVILDASLSPSRHGQIRQVISFTTSSDVRVVIDGTWPYSDPSSYDIQSNVSAMTAKTLNLSGSKSLLLFDGPTGLVDHIGHINEFLDKVSAQLIDVVTFGPAGEAMSFNGEPVLTVQPGDVITQPMTKTKPSDWYLIGQPTINGMIQDVGLAYPLNPGIMNPIRQASPQVPEPYTIGLVVCVLLFSPSILGRPLFMLTC